MSYLDWPISRIAIEVPGATAIFFKHKINFCCDGQKLLSEVLEKKSLDKESILKALESKENNVPVKEDLHKLSNQQIIDFLLERFHKVHREQLPELQRLSKKVESVHQAHPLCPRGLTQHLADMESELVQHMHKEESILFPILSNNVSPLALGPISVMRTEHEEHLSQIETIYKLTQDVTPHADACNTWRALYSGLRDFISDLNEHIHTENNILFNRACA